MNNWKDGGGLADSGGIDSVSAKNNGVSTKLWEDFDKNKKYSQSFDRKYGGVSIKK